MTRRIQLAAFVVLLALLVWLVGSRFFGRGPDLGGVFANEKYVPLNVPDPTLRLDLLERARKAAYEGSKRDIFSFVRQAEKVVDPPSPVVVPGPQLPPPDPAPAPLVVNFRFYGYKEDPRTGQRRAFFIEGENVIFASVGDTIQNRFRLLKIGNQSAEVEEISSGRRQTLQLEAPPQQ
jgi:hypothetical protein